MGKCQEKAIAANQIKAGMVVKLTMIQAWRKHHGRLVPFADTLVIEDAPIDAAAQAAEWQEYFLDVRVIDVSTVSPANGPAGAMIRIVHCSDRTEQHTIYVLPSESVVVIGEFKADSKRSQKRNRQLKPLPVRR